MVVDFQVIAQRRFELSPRREAGLVDDLADAAIEAFDHAIGLRMAWWDQAVLDHQLPAQDVKGMLASRDTVAGFRVLLLAGETARELAAVVGEQLDDGDRTGLFDLEQKVGAAAVGLVGIDIHENPARGTVNRDEQVTAFSFVGHLRQVLDIHM